MGNWKKYFNIVRIQPGRVDTGNHGMIDLRYEDYPVEKMKALYDDPGFPFLELTEEGKKKFEPQTEPKPKKQKEG